MISRFLGVRALSEALAAPLSAEDQGAQSMPDASPTKWHLAHTSWFFETFALAGRPPFDPAFAVLFNSYYEAVGPRHPRPRRGLLTRPGAERVAAYRRHVTEAVRDRLAEADPRQFRRLAPVIALGMAHEQQHQELICTDILHLFAGHPLLPVAEFDDGIRQLVRTMR